MAHIGIYHRTVYCEHCNVVAVLQGVKYCEGCAEEVLNWLYESEQAEYDRLDEAAYMAALESKQLEFWYE